MSTKMSIVAFLLLVLLITLAKSEQVFETTCKNDYRDLNNTPINVLKYCSNSVCIDKCCGAGEIMNGTDTCFNMEEFVQKNPKAASHLSKINYSINILSSGDVNKKYNFVLIHNNRDVYKCSAMPNTDADSEYDISEDGSLRWQDSVSNKWKKMEKLTYCIDYKLFRKPDGRPGFKIIIRQNTIGPEETEEIEAFEIVALLISSFFLILVLVVYCLLPDLRNMTGLVMMAYTFSLLFAFVNKLILNFVKRAPPVGFCKNFSPVVYFAFMSSIFWLSAISFELWWGLRSFRNKSNSKRSNRLKFMWYSLYAWGTPLVITAIVTTLDNIPYMDLSVEPPFKDCLMNGEKFDYYFKIPIGILIFINIVLFVMTVYNIWMVNYAVKKSQDSRRSKQQNYKFSTYAKLSVMMGLSWCLELLPTIDMLWFYILTNLYNLLIGVNIFYLFLCKKTVLVQLCRKFNIRNDFTKKWDSEVSQYNKSGITRSTVDAGSIVKNRSKDQNQEMDLLKDCPVDEITTVV